MFYNRMKNYLSPSLIAHNLPNIAIFFRKSVITYLLAIVDVVDAHSGQNENRNWIPLHELQHKQGVDIQNVDIIDGNFDTY